MSTVHNQFSNEVNFELALLSMDDAIRIMLTEDNSAQSDQQFFDLYCICHMQKFGKPFEYDTEKND